jgi:hypothetical protein
MNAIEADTSTTPTKLYPNKHVLQKTLQAYKTAKEDRDGYANKLSKTEIELDKVLNNTKLSEEIASERIAKLQADKSMYAARVTQREQAVAKVFGELISAVKVANSEKTGVIATESARIKDVLVDRVTKAVGGLTESPGYRHELENFLHEFSGPVARLRMLEGTSYLDEGNETHVMEMARTILSQFDRFLFEVGKEI